MMMAYEPSALEDMLIHCCSHAKLHIFHDSKVCSMCHIYMQIVMYENTLLHTMVTSCWQYPNIEASDSNPGCCTMHSIQLLYASSF